MPHPTSTPQPIATGRSLVSTQEVAPGQVALFIDGMESSFHDLRDPTHLEFEYMQHMDAAVRVHFGPAVPVRALHLGGGGCSLPRAWDATRPGSTQLAVEWDPEIARLAREWFPLPRAPRLKIRTADARTALAGFPAARWDVIVRDVFVSGMVPAHLADHATWAHAARVVTPEGLAVFNLADSGSLLAARQEVKFARSVFPQVLLVADPSVLKGRRFGNLVIVAAHHDFDGVALAQSLARLPMPARMVSASDTARFAS